ncbi:MAG: phytanoyl-CoA dioxygenase family protein [Alphaproteobacteria bacterium]
MIDLSAANRPRPTKDSARLKADIDTFGYGILADALTPAQLTAVRSRVEEQFAAERAQGIERRAVQHYDQVNQWVTMLINKGAVFGEIAENPRTLEFVGHVLGKDYLLSVLEAHFVRKGGKLMPLHCDQWWLPFPAKADSHYARVGDITRSTVPMGPEGRAEGPVWPPGVVNVMYMVTDFTDENGGTRVVPGSHLSGWQPDQAIPHPVETVAAEGPAGSAVIFEGRTWHAAGVNRTEQHRIGITATYCGPMFRQLTNFPVGTHAAVIERASPRLRALLGLKVWSTYGGIDDHTVEFIERREGEVGELKQSH